MLGARVRVVPRDGEFKVRVEFYDGLRLLATHGVCVFQEEAAEAEAVRARESLDRLGIYEPRQENPG